jgi:hypothetical protein
MPSGQPGSTIGFYLLLGSAVSLLALAVAGLYLHRNGPLKRKLLPWLVALAVVAIFLGAGLGPAFLVGSSWASAWLALVIAIPAALFYYWRTYICEDCGRTIYCDPLYGEITYCPVCGGRLSR